MRDLSKKFPDLWIQTKDNDGDFLLIEASATLPAWLEPGVARNRAWINQGHLKIIRPSSTTRSSRTTREELSLAEAKAAILNEPKRIMKSASIEEEAFFRLKDYPSKIAYNMHHALLDVPRKIAFLLHQKPAYIAAAIEAFYLRDPIALKPLHESLRSASWAFPPEDLVPISVKFPRVGYAQVKSQDFPPPAVWQAKLPKNTEGAALAKAQTGMKITCGFEMLLSDAQHQDRPAVREMKMLLSDLDSGDESLPSNEEMLNWEKRQDDEKWLDIGFDDLENELDGRGGKTKDRKRAAFGDRAAQENLQRIVKEFEAFMNDDRAGSDGAGFFDVDTDDESVDSNERTNQDVEETGEDVEASFDEDEFTKMMQEMMGMPSEVMREIMAHNPSEIKGSPSSVEKRQEGGGRVTEVDTSESEGGEEEIHDLTQRMEAELKEKGALDLSSAPPESTDANRAVKGKQPAPTAEDGSEHSLSDEEENDVNINLVRNLLESFKSQAGASGPAGNLMGLMGARLPRDETDASRRSSSRP